MKRKQRTRQDVGAPSWLIAGPLVLAFLASIVWAVWSVLPLVPAVLMASEIENYRPAQFVVDEVVYRTYRRGGDRYYAKGRIAGQPEVLELYDVAPVLETRDALEKHFGQQPVILPVMYNPTRMHAKRNDGSMRVLPTRERFAETCRNEAWLAAFSTLGSIIVAALSLMTLLWMHKRPGKSESQRASP